MTGIRRLATILGMTFGVVVAASVPASAGFAEVLPFATMSLSTGTVDAVTQLEAKAVCTTTVEPATGATTTVDAKIEWHASTIRGVSGYRVMVHLADGTTSLFKQTNASTIEVFASYGSDYLAKKPRYSVTTLTSYGWTATTAPSGVLSC